MQFSIISIVAALAATATAAHVPVNGTSAYYPTGTGTAAPTVMPTSSTLPFTGGASMPTHWAGSALGLVVAGGVALVL
ncbi:hypothetical protein BDW02DRAFT_602283 [Decorospora gaudefroyi]|uniref:Uncharacterized protein n=1 Tax=Decorospora gaudefroyi TaxID=184978 RepID=A0A6A5K8R4_9PLEO|nr:hypothetical protein BDW02DRAFT_602283 [Decorospora gaudefroyi]